MKIKRRETIIPFCACGCGEFVEWNNDKKDWNRFIYHHQNKGDNNPSKKKWVRKKMSKAAIKKFKDNPDLINTISNSVKKLWDNKEYREKQNKSRGEVYKTKEYKEKRSNITKELWEREEYIEKQSEAWAKSGLRIKENHYNWQGGISKEPYSQDWDRELREIIKERDGYICQVCLKPEIEFDRKLTVHHIDYDKKNCKEENLISLCTSCHTKTNYNREQWQLVFESR
jgi:5-methylcytosine-specific restriction endonuclease McrA